MSFVVLLWIIFVTQIRECRSLEYFTTNISVNYSVIIINSFGSWLMVEDYSLLPISFVTVELNIFFPQM
jgi:hypothetical protein